MEFLIKLVLVELAKSVGEKCTHNFLFGKNRFEEVIKIHSSIIM